jgi:eukaryotic-like serine/threonine-protein kinase
MTPTVISHYRLLEPLGEGGMGKVYRAEDLRLGREVAIKLLRTDSQTSAEWKARFEREARLASSLQHPHICTIHELGEHEGQPFIVMERLEGRTVRQILEDGPVPIPRLLEFARQIADALDAAHRRDIIHRDIKPANLFVTFGDHLKVLDFGLAKSTADVLPEPIVPSDSAPTMTAPGLELTNAGVAMGTAAYMSPEQALGQPLDARSDLFSLGAVLYEMATGRRAFADHHRAMIISRITNGIIVAPRAIDATIPENVEAIILKLMAVEPTARYQSAADLLADVNAALEQLEHASDSAPGAPGIAPPGRPKWSMRHWATAAAVVVLLLVGIARFTWPSRRAAALTDRDSILIGAFENTSGDPVFDETLATALRVQLGQSPFLDIIADQRVQETLRSMGRRADERLTQPVAREVCQRLALKTMIEGSIAAMGKSYVLRLAATDCQTGETLGREQAEATSRERVLKELGSMTSSLRTTLGESLPSRQRFDVPIEQATTPSLTALKAYALGLEERRRGRELESVAFFNQAIELDHEFASAYATLSTVYGSLGEWRRSEEFARVAYVLQGRVSERERLFITYQFHDRVSGDQDKAAETLALWKEAYPRESRPVNALALIHNRMGRYEQAEAEAREALRRSPGHPFPLSNLAIAFRARGRYADARKTGEEAMALGVETTPTRRLLYQVGMLAGDGSAAAHVAWAKDRPREFDLVSAQAQVAAFEGRMRDATELYRRAADMAVARGLRGTASGYAAQLAFAEALYREGPDAAASVRRALALVNTDADGPGTLPRFRAPVALAMVGAAADALPIVTAAEQRYAQATFVRGLLGPVTRAAIALRQRKAADAVKALEPAGPTELGTVAGLVPVYLRAEALVQSGALHEGIREYQRILEHRGVDPFAPVVPLAQLGLARAHARTGDIAVSRAAYQELFTIWKSADADFPPLLRARAEHARLTRSGTTAP